MLMVVMPTYIKRVWRKCQRFVVRLKDEKGRYCNEQRHDDKLTVLWTSASISNIDIPKVSYTEHVLDFL